jgi:hypothetical protein
MAHARFHQQTRDAILHLLLVIRIESVRDVVNTGITAGLVKRRNESGIVIATERHGCCMDKQ